MELLAPAGSLSAFDAALDEGADAFYVGAPGFNARALARDLSYAEIAAMIEAAHGKEKKLYIAMNSLIKETEIPKAVEALDYFSRLKPDALIIQDLGLLYLARNFFPELPLHASTLMSVHNSSAVNWLLHMGFERVVLARELTLKEMHSIHATTGAELEVFVHGAMCFSYSGLCLFSSMHGGKSSLRGQCVQPCRRNYKWLQPKGRLAKGGTRKNSEGYLFSMNDLCGIDLLPELHKAGVASLKIEGRLKSAEYVRKTVKAYRLVLDTIHLNEQERQGVLHDAHHLLDEAMGRKRSSGYFLTTTPDSIITPSSSGTSGLFLGKVIGHAGKTSRNNTVQGLKIHLQQPLSVGDRVRLHDDSNGDRVSFSVKNIQFNDKSIQNAQGGQTIFIGVPSNFSGKLLGTSQQTLYKIDVRARKKIEQVVRKKQLVLKSRKIFSDAKKIESILRTLSLNSGIPTGKKQPRQTGPAFKGKSNKNNFRKQQISNKCLYLVRVKSLADIKQKMPVQAFRFLVPLPVENIFGKNRVGKAGSRGQSKIIWTFPPVIHEDDIIRYQKNVVALLESGFSEFQLGHCSQIEFFRQNGKVGYEGVTLYSDYTFNVLNSLSLRLVEQMGITGIQFSIESDQENMAASLTNFFKRPQKKSGKNPIRLGMLVYGRVPLFTSRLEIGHLHYGHRFVSPKNEHFVMEKKNGLTLGLSSIPFSLSEHADEIVEIGINFLVVDMSGGSVKMESQIVTALLNNTGKKQRVLSGNFKKNLL
jgi:putative protease